MYDFIRKIDDFCGYKNDWAVVRDEDTDERYGRYADKRPIEELLKYGVINLDKPPGPTSHEVAYWIKQMLGLKRVGHGGTLEPLQGGGETPR